MISVKCKKCGKENLIQGSPYTSLPLCGICREQLPEPISIQLARVAIKYKYLLIILVFVGGVNLTGKLDNQNNTTNERTIKSSFSKPDYPPVPINQGVKQKFTNEESIATFTIVTPPGPENYFVKIINAHTGATVITLYIFGGQRYQTMVPIGSYRFKYATGKIWYGDDHLFGPNTQYSEADRTIEFTQQGNQINGLVITLIRRVDGNFPTKPISANKF